MISLLYMKAVILGVVEGLTEFLPVSSTGHLIIVGDFLHFNGEKAKVFEIVIQLGAILAVCWEYRAKLAAVVVGLPSDRSAQRFVLNLLVAFVPAAVLGLLFHRYITDYLFNPVTVAVALVVGGLVILVVEKTTRSVRVHSVDDMLWSDALKVGLAQCFSLIPGTSRAGATIVGGLLSGLSRKTATEFSFFLAIPVMFAATAFDLFENRHLLGASDLGVFAVGFGVAFLAALAAVRALLRYISQHDFVAFGWYRIALGALVLLYFH
jgi:undecaprenyl-diphosphatase